MKPFMMMLAMVLATTANLFAQQDTVTTQTESYNKVISKTTYTRSGEDGTTQSSIININFPWRPMPWDYDEAHYSFLYFNFAFASDKNIPLNSVKSWEWGMYPLSGVLFQSDDYRKMLTWGFGFSRTSFKLKDQEPTGDKKGFTDQRFRYWSWRLPISVELRSQNLRNFVTAGVEVEMRHHVRARGYRDDIDMSKYEIVGLDKNIVNPWSCNLLFQAGHEDLGVIGRVSLTDLFDKENTHLKAMPFSIGISLGF